MTHSYYAWSTNIVVVIYKVFLTDLPGAYSAYYMIYDIALIPRLLLLVRSVDRGRCAEGTWQVKLKWPLPQTSFFFIARAICHSDITLQLGTFWRASSCLMWWILCTGYLSLSLRCLSAYIIRCRLDSMRHCLLRWPMYWNLCLLTTPASFGNNLLDWFPSYWIFTPVEFRFGALDNAEYKSK